MSHYYKTVSIVIPTHNRVYSIKRQLDKLGSQTYPLHLMEVLAVANSCTDTTVKMLQDYSGPYTLRYAETSGDGPAIARNKGASLATGSVIIFLDDDIDPSDGLVEAHVSNHKNDNTVVIGYLPLAVPRKPGFFKLNLMSWWEKKFQEMRNPGYRYSYEDLLSGNFSISSELFKKTQGFDTSLRCRDDYELGIRLIKSGADLIFSDKAWGFHRDEVTDLNRSLKRKREEGRTDVRLWRMHPDIITSLQQSYGKGEYTFMQSKAVFFELNWPNLTDIFVSFLAYLMKGLERLRLRSIWGALHYKLHIYWYLRGLLDELHSRNELISYLQSTPQLNLQEDELEINLKGGIEAAEHKLDEARPAIVQLRFGDQLVGLIPFKPGAERLRGIHLRRILATKLSKPLLKTLALDQLLKKPVDVD